MKENLHKNMMELQLKIERELDTIPEGSVGNIMKEMLELLQQCYHNNVTGQSERTWLQQRIYEIKKTEIDNGSNAMIVAHIVPQSSYNDEFSINLETYNEKFLPTLDGEQSYTRRINIDGIFYSDYYGKSYTQLYRNGVAEFVSKETLDEKKLFPHLIENGIISTISNYMRVMGEDTGGSLTVHISLLNVKGYRFPFSTRMLKNPIIDRDDIYLPEISLETSPNTNIQESIRPAMDVMWNAAGFLKAYPANVFY